MNNDTTKTILLAEDEALYRKVLGNKLQQDGYHVVIATNGEEALEITKTTIPNIILMDLIMPGKDGFQTLQEMRSDPRLKDVKIIILSNLGQEEDKVKVMALGATDYLVKADTQLSEVVSKIKNYLQ